MSNNVKRTFTPALIVMILTGMIALIGGCTFSLDGIGDFSDYVVHVFGGCNSCDYVRMLQYN